MDVYKSVSSSNIFNSPGNRSSDLLPLLVIHRRFLILRLVDIGEIVDHHSLEVIVRLVDIDGIVDHLCLEVIISWLILMELLTSTA
jgi:hypothetical protein